jgi:hypothetical protein
VQSDAFTGFKGAEIETLSLLTAAGKRNFGSFEAVEEADAKVACEFARNLDCCRFGV